MIKNYTLAEILLICLISASLFGQNFNYISDYDGQGVPLDMVNTAISQNLLDNISASFPEGYPVPEYNPEYISDSVETNVVLTDLADVWVTFVGEGAGYKNVLGFYTYDKFDPPTSPPSDEDITIIFPNVSASGSGGGLFAGDKMYLGQFPPNTVIGWVLIANGWNGNQVTYGNWMVYSNPYFNPEGSPDLQKHNVNLYDNNELVVVFGFEDIRRDFSSCDQDFNDALFLVTSNPYTAMETSNFNPISTDGGGQSSGNDGGLESNRGLSSAIAHRYFDRSKKEEKRFSQISHTRNNTLLSKIVPTSLKAGDNRTISSPIDLEYLTKADLVWSADYFIEDDCYASVFATETTGEVYGHTKVVCDRLAGSEIVNIKEVTILDNKFLLTSLKTNKGTTEYSISFSIELVSEQEFGVFSKWAVDQYEQGAIYFNYQIWSSAPFSTIEIAKQIIENLKATHTIIPNQESISFLPNIYIKSGAYKTNTIEINLMNTTEEVATVNLVGSLSESEIDENLELYFKTITVLPGEHKFNIKNPNKDIFDIEIKVRKDDAVQYDVAYFSDGAWGLDYNQSLTTITDLEITNNAAESADEFTIARNLSLELESEDYISVYKHLKPSGRTVNLESYNAISFEGGYSNPIQIRLIKEGIEKWEDQFLYTLNPSKSTDEKTIPFSYFRSKTEESIDFSDVKMITFTQVSNTGIDKKLEFKNIRFTADEELMIAMNKGLHVYPNPTFGKINMTFESIIDEQGTIEIYNILGKKIYSQRIRIHQGLNVIQRDLDQLDHGIHILKIEGDTSNSYEQKIIIN